MDVLMRKLNGEPYVWAKAKFTDGHIKVNDRAVNECDIVSIRNDIRKKYVKCSVCGKYFRKGSPKIEQHTELITDNRLCFGCECLRQSTREQKSQKYELLENGNYLSKNKSEVFLYCSRGYSYNSINSDEARRYCKYNKCHDASMVDATGFFLEAPGAFDDIITIDKVLENGYKESWFDNYDKITHYKLKARNTIEALVNKLNIVEGFYVYYGRTCWTLYYSKKYDELYVKSGQKYQRWFSYHVGSDVRERIKDKIASLYV